MCLPKSLSPWPHELIWERDKGGTPYSKSFRPKTAITDRYRGYNVAREVSDLTRKICLHF